MLKKIFFKFQQKLKFSESKLAKIDHADSKIILFPGCAAHSIDKGTIANLKTALERKNNCQISIIDACCGLPTKSLSGEELYKQRQKKIIQKFKQNNIQTIYTFCPNCKNELSGFDIVVKLIWENLEINDFKASSLINTNNKLYIHDSCVSRHDTATQDKARELLEACGYELLEFKNNRSHAVCCGRKNMQDVLNPTVSKDLASKKIEESNNIPIATYCISCRDSFKKHGGQAFHLLDLLEIRGA